MPKKIIIVGAGPGGLTAGMLLSHRGFEVEILEKEPKVGGRNASIEAEGYKFDVGPTFLMMRFILDEVFEESGGKSTDYLKFTRLDPMYRLYFKDERVDVSDDHASMKEAIKKVFPGNEAGYERFLAREKTRYERMYPCLQKSYDEFKTFFHSDFLKALPHLSLGRSMFSELGNYYRNSDLKISFTFQSKYLGMSPWECPAAFLIIPYIEHAFGVYHVEGGLSEISAAMAKVIEEKGGKIRLDTPVKKIMVQNGRAKGVELASGDRLESDLVIVNADFAYAMTELVEQGALKKYSRKNLLKKTFSCSTYMLYLGVNKKFDVPHHNVVFSRDYGGYINAVAGYKYTGDDLSVYIRNASITDPTLAPEGKSNVYLLVPVANNKSGVAWKEKEEIRDRVLEIIAQRTEMGDISSHIEFERHITPNDWESKYNVFLGATFNLGHNLTQMLYFRPHNKFEELENCYLVGGGTHPGSGLPTIYESGRITANLISKRFQVPFESKNIQA